MYTELGCCSPIMGLADMKEENPMCASGPITRMGGLVKWKEELSVNRNVISMVVRTK